MSEIKPHVFFAKNDGTPGWAHRCVECGETYSRPQHNVTDETEIGAALVKAIEGR